MRNSDQEIRAAKKSARSVALAKISLSALLMSALPGLALGQAAESKSIDEITVTSSRVVRDGFQAPTPTTVIGAVDIQNAAQINVFNYLAQLPALAGNVSTQSGNNLLSNGIQGIDAFNLRGLGTNRTLVLLDGRRTVGSSLAGVVDVSQIPQDLIARVDVVTGGASAAWGSDAVGGVVNFVLNKKFTGFKAEIAAAETTYSDDFQSKVTMTYGSAFAGGRGHFLLSGEINQNAGIPGQVPPRPWYNGTKYLQYTIAQTPAGLPQYLVRPNVGNNIEVDGGLITAGPLAGTAFGAGGKPYQFQYGTRFYANSTGGAAMAGGQWESTDIAVPSLDAELNRKIVFSHASFDLTEKTTAWAEIAYANIISDYQAVYNHKPGNLTIQCDNPFLPAEIPAACTTNKITSFAFGTLNKALGIESVHNIRSTPRAAAGIDGSLTVAGKEWTWAASTGWGGTMVDSNLYNNTLTPRYLAAIDAVRLNGQIVCRSAVARADGCVPLNVIGTDDPGAAAKAYVLGVAKLHQHYQQVTAGFSANGEPFNVWAGPVTVAFGADYRKEKVHGTQDCASSSDCGNPLLDPGGRNWMSGNFNSTAGAYDVKEAFVNTVVPVVRDLPFAKSLDLELAGRVTDYSRSGVVQTWKFGFNYSPIDDIRIRGTRSRDIRAPNLADLFNAGSISGGVSTELDGPFVGQTSRTYTKVVGNLNLKPEIAESAGLGVVLRPRWLQGFAASVDYYDIALSDVITSLSSQQEQTLCVQGNQTICALIARTPEGRLDIITTPPLNLASQHTMGFDYEATYRQNLAEIADSWSGNVTLRALATQVVTNKTNSGLANTIPVELAGVGSSASPRWRLVLSESYQNERFTTALTQRFVSKGVLSNAFIECTTGCPLPTLNNPTIDNNQVKSVWYVDYTAAYKFKVKSDLQTEAFFRVDNLLNAMPPTVAGSGNVSLGVANVGIYDNLGRFYRVGLRVKM